MGRGNQGSWDDAEVFRKKGARVGDPKISIAKSYTILFGSAFWHKAGLENKKRVLLGYSRSMNSIFFDFTEDEKVKDGFTVIHRNKSTASTTCRSFFHTYDLDARKIAGSYKPHKEKIPKIGECWVIDLDKKIEK